jgi:hypothetical protein
MKLFGGLIGWRTNKQNTIVTSITEAELLALAQAAKESMYVSRLLQKFTIVTALDPAYGPVEYIRLCPISSAPVTAAHRALTCVKFQGLHGKFLFAPHNIAAYIMHVFCHDC